MSKTILLALSLLLMPLASMAACPLGAKEDHLTVQRVMRNFGRFVGFADNICVIALNSWVRDPIPDAKLMEALDKLGMSIDCANDVLKNPTGDVLPSKLILMKDEPAKAELVDDYIYFMTDYRDGLTEYRELFQKLLTQKPEERDFTEANEKRLELDKLVERAHKKL